MNVLGKLVSAQAEDLAADPANLPLARFWYDSVADTFKAKFGSLVKTFATTDLAIVNPMNAFGDVLYGAVAGAATRLGAGTSGQFFQTTGVGTAPKWNTELLVDTNLGTNLTTWNIAGTVAGRSGGLRLRSSDTSLSFAIYGATSDSATSPFTLGTVTNHGFRFQTNGIVRGGITEAGVWNVNFTGYIGSISGDGTSMKIGHDSAARALDFQTNSLTRASISGAGDFTLSFTGYVGKVVGDGTSMKVGHDSAVRALDFQTDSTTRASCSGSTGSWTFGDGGSARSHLFRGVLNVFDDASSTAHLNVTADSGSFASNVLQLDANRGANAAFNFIECRSDADGTPATRFMVSGTGVVTLGLSSGTGIATAGGTVHAINGKGVTSANTGANGATPAQVAGYLEVMINGTAFRIPCYNS